MSALRRVPPAVVLVTVALVVALGALLTRSVGTWGPQARADVPGAAVATARPVTEATLVCASMPPTSDAVENLVSAAAPPGGAGTLTLASLGRPATPLARAAAGSTVLRYVPRPGTRGPLLVHATGDLARGLTALAQTRTSSGTSRSLSTSACTAPAAESWFVGGGASIGRRSVLYLTDADVADAVVDVTVYTADGPQQPTSAQGVTVGAGKQVVLALDTLVPGADSTAVHVQARSGRVAAALLDSQVHGISPGGLDWVPPAAEPGRHLVVSGVAADRAARRLLTLLVPGTDDAQVRVRLSTADGVLSPEPLSALLVAGGRLQTYALPPSAAFGAYAVLVDSDHPLVAGVRALNTPAGVLPDFSYGASAPSVVGGAVVLPRAERHRRVTTVLQLTNPGSADTTVRLVTLATGGIPGIPVTRTVPAGRTVLVVVGRPATTAILVETAPLADVVVGWELAEAGAHGPLVTSGTLPQTPFATRVPPAVPDPATGFPGR